MAADRVARTTTAVCGLAAVAEVALGCTGTAGLTPGDAVVLPLVVGPYLALAALARRSRGRRRASLALLAVATGLSAWGLLVFGEDAYRYHTEPHYRMVQRTAVFFVPLVQWAAVLVVGLGLWARGPGARRERPEDGARPGGAPDGGVGPGRGPGRLAADGELVGVGRFSRTEVLAMGTGPRRPLRLASRWLLGLAAVSVPYALAAGGVFGLHPDAEGAVARAAPLVLALAAAGATAGAAAVHRSWKVALPVAVVGVPAALACAAVVVGRQMGGLPH